MRLILAGTVLAGCAYQASSFESEFQAFRGQRASMGCLDLAVERRPDLARGDIVLAYAFGNRCEHPAIVDLTSVTVFGRDADGHAIPLRPYDPRSEIDARWLDGCAVGGEVLAYSTTAELVDVCVDVGAIARDSAHWLCFASQPQRWRSRELQAHTAVVVAPRRAPDGARSTGR